jgi:predicted nucleotidyltransferase
MPRTSAAKRVGPLRSLGERAAGALARYEDVVAVCLLGSVARGDARGDSDIDLLVVTETAVQRSHLIRRLPPSARDDRLSLICFSTEQWWDEVRRRSLFLHHVRLEGEAIYDPDDVLRRGLASVGRTSPDVGGELRRQLDRLRLYRDVERLNGQHLFALAHLYAIGKAAAIARCAELGRPTFVKEEALLTLASCRPEFKDATTTISRLRPFYDVARGRDAPSLPFEPVNAEGEVARAIDAIELLARE